MNKSNACNSDEVLKKKEKKGTAKEKMNMKKLFKLKF